MPLLKRTYIILKDIQLTIIIHKKKYFQTKYLKPFFSNQWINSILFGAGSFSDQQPPTTFKLPLG